MPLSYGRNKSIDNIPGSSIGPAEISVDQRIHGIDSSEVRSILEGDTDTQCHSANCAPRLKKGFAPAGKQCCYICGFPAFQAGGKTSSPFSVQCEHVVPVAALSILCGLSPGSKKGGFHESYKELKKRIPIQNELFTMYEKWQQKIHGGEGGDYAEGGGPLGSIYLWAHPSCNEIKSYFPFLLLNFTENQGFTFINDDGKILLPPNCDKKAGHGEKNFKNTVNGWGGYIDSCISTRNLIWLLGSLVGLNNDGSDGGSKSTLWRMGITGYKCDKPDKKKDGKKHKNLKKMNVKEEIKKGGSGWGNDDLYHPNWPFASLTKDKMFNQLKRINLWEDGEMIKEGIDPREWVKKRMESIKMITLYPLLQNILEVDGDEMQGPILEDPSTSIDEIQKIQLYSRISIATTQSRIVEKIKEMPKNLFRKVQGKICKKLRCVWGCHLWEKMVDHSISVLKIKDKDDTEQKKELSLIRKALKSDNLSKFMGKAWLMASNLMKKKKSKANIKKKNTQKKRKNKRTKRRKNKRTNKLKGGSAGAAAAASAASAGAAAAGGAAAASSSSQESSIPDICW